MKDSYNHPNEHIILYVFHAPRYDSPVPLNWYKQYPINFKRINLSQIIGGKHFTVPYTVFYNGYEVNTTALINTKVNSFTFINTACIINTAKFLNIKAI